MSDVKGIVFLKSYFDSISMITDKEVQADLYNVIFNYAFYNKLPDTENQYIKAMFELYKPTIDDSLSKYKSKVERMKKINEKKNNDIGT